MDVDPVGGAEGEEEVFAVGVGVFEGVPSRRVAASVNLPWGLVTRVGPPANLAA